MNMQVLVWVTFSFMQRWEPLNGCKCIKNSMIAGLSLDLYFWKLFADTCNFRFRGLFQTQSTLFQNTNLPVVKPQAWLWTGNTCSKATLWKKKKTVLYHHTAFLSWKYRFFFSKHQKVCWESSDAVCVFTVGKVPPPKKSCIDSHWFNSLKPQRNTTVWVSVSAQLQDKSCDTLQGQVPRKWKGHKKPCFNKAVIIHPRFSFFTSLLETKLLLSWRELQ